MKILIIAIVLIIAIFGIYTLVSDDSAADDLIIPQENYSNNKYGISFDYPKDQYVLTEQAIGPESGGAERDHYVITLVRNEDSIPPRNGEGPTGITIDIYQNDLDEQSLVDWLKNTSNSNFKLSNGSYASTTVAGTDALTYSWSGLYEADASVFEHDGNIVAVTVTYLTPEDENRFVYQKILDSLELR